MVNININEVEDLEVDGVNYWDYPDFADAYFSSGTINGVPLTEDELDELGRLHPDVLYNLALDYLT